MVQVIKDYGSPIKWNIGSLFAHDKYIWDLIDVIKDIGYENPISYVFGSIPCLFQGGRIPPRDAKVESALSILDEYNKRDVGCRLTFSNMFISETDLKDILSNKLLSHLNNSEYNVKNGVIVASDLLAKYIRDTYPNLELIASQVKPSCEVGLGPDDNNDTVEYYNKLFDTYDIVVVNPFKVQDGGFINSIKYPERVEFIANHRCVPNCPMSKLHYETQMRLGMGLLYGENIEQYEKTLSEIHRECIKVKSSYPLAGTTLSQSEIENLVRLGFINFKLEGRDNSGECFIRDIGDYIFIPYLYQRISASIMQGVV